MTTFLLLLLFPSIALLVYSGLVMREVYLDQSSGRSARKLTPFVKWLRKILKFKTRRRHRYYVMIFIICLVVILCILILMPFNTINNNAI